MTRSRNGPRPLRRTAWPTALAAALLLGACSQPPVPKDSFYRLQTGAPQRQFAEPALPGVVEVSRFTADGVINERALAYMESGGKLQQYSYHYWAESPTQLVQDALVQALRESGAAMRAVTPAMRLRPHYLMQGKLHRFEQVIEGDSARVVAALEVSLTQARDGNLILLETYRVERPARDDSVGAAIDARRDAVGDLAARLLDDLAALLG